MVLYYSPHVRLLLFVISTAMLSCTFLPIKCAINTDVRSSGLIPTTPLAAVIFEKIKAEAARCKEIYTLAGKGIDLELFRCGAIIGLHMVTDYIWREIKHVIQEEIYPGESDFDRGQYFRGSSECAPGWAVALWSSIDIMHAARAGSLQKLTATNLIIPSAKILGARTAGWGLHALIKSMLGTKKTSNHNHSNVLAIAGHTIGTCEPLIVNLGTCAWIIHKRYSLTPI